MSKYHDLKDHPKYARLAFGEIDALDVLQRVLTPKEFQGYCLGNSIFYQLRAGVSGSDPTDDLAKADLYRKLLGCETALKSRQWKTPHGS